MDTLNKLSARYAQRPIGPSQKNTLSYGFLSGFLQASFRVSGWANFVFQQRGGQSNPRGSLKPLPFYPVRPRFFSKPSPKHEKSLYDHVVKPMF